MWRQQRCRCDTAASRSETWTASTFIYEAVALSPAALRVNDWVAGIVQGGNAEQQSMRDMTAIAVMSTAIAVGTAI